MFLCLLVAIAITCTGFQDQDQICKNSRDWETRDSLSRVAFGSCSKSHKPQKLWETIAAVRPDVFMWTGDAVYTNTSDLKDLENAFTHMLENEEYTRFLETRVRVVGAIDDHDYGVNDAGKHVHHRNERIQAYLKFLDASNHDRRWSHPDSTNIHTRDGLYSAHTFGEPGKQVKLIMLDTRTHRDEFSWNLPHWLTDIKLPVISRYYGKVNTLLRTLATLTDSLVDTKNKGDMLGDEQWQWLDKTLQDSQASFHIIVSSVQVWTTNPFVESWGHFPFSRQRLTALLEKHNLKGTLIISGDVHFAELIKDASANSQAHVVELTSSGMTHFVTKKPIVGSMAGIVLSYFSDHRPSPELHYATGINFGTLDFRWPGGEEQGEVEGSCGDTPEMMANVHDEAGNIVIT